MGFFPQVTPGVISSQTRATLGSPFSLVPRFPITVSVCTVSAYCMLPCARCLWRVRQTCTDLGQMRCGHRKVTCHWLREVLRAH